MSENILLVDDDPLIRTVVADNLSDFGFIVHVASGEAQAFERLRTDPTISLAVVDYCLPRPIGIEICRRIASEFPDMPVALYTGHGELADLRRGDDDLAILSKTLRTDQLATALNDLLSGRKPDVVAPDLSSRAEILWRQEARRETVRAVTRAMHNQFDRALQEPVPAPLTATVLRLVSGKG